MKLLPYLKYKPSVGVEVRGLKYVSVSCDPQKRRSRIDGQTAMRATSCELFFDALEIQHAVAARPPTQ